MSAFDDIRVKHQRFVIEYVDCWSATEAYRRVYGGNHCNTLGPRLYAKVGIKEAIEDFMSRTPMTGAEVLTRLGQYGRATIADFIDDEGALDWKKVKLLGHLIKKITPNRYGFTIELHDPQAALIKIGEYRKLFANRTVLEDPDGKAVQSQVILYMPDNGRPNNDTDSNR